MILITGGAGFIGSHLIMHLTEKDGIKVIDKATVNSQDLLTSNIKKSLEDVDTVFHFAANPSTREDNFEEDVIATKRLLDAMIDSDVKRIIYTSSSAVYGYPCLNVTEHYPCRSISHYGASKQACEGLINAYSNLYGFNAIILRLANVVGEGCHGILDDFIQKLRKDPKTLNVLGNGNQAKPFIHITDVMTAIDAVKGWHGCEIFNVGTDDTAEVSWIAEIVAHKMNLKPKITFRDDEAGWPGDVPRYLLNTNKIRMLGWKPRYNSHQAILRAIEEML